MADLWRSPPSAMPDSKPDLVLTWIFRRGRSAAIREISSVSLAGRRYKPARYADALRL